MTTIREWLTVPQAGFYIGKDPSRIYAWIRQSKVIRRYNSDGILEVLTTSLTTAEATTTRGRPRGTATRR